MSENERFLTAQERFFDEFLCGLLDFMFKFNEKNHS